jgi:SAM-dependent methyltransferase
MTAEQLETARANVDDMTAALGYKQSNLKFVEGMIEFLGAAGVEPNSMDLIISNCVINLSPDKGAVIKSCYEALRDGGELYFSDIYCDRRLPQATR